MSTKSNVVSRFTLITFIAICSFFWAGSLFAAGCSVDCSGGSCSATGANAECWCHWWSGNPCCTSGGKEISQEFSAESNKGFSETDLSFAQRGGDLEALLNSDLDEFYGMVVKNLGFDERVEFLFRAMRSLKTHYDAGDQKGYLSAEAILEDQIRDFSAEERETIADLALGIIEIR